MQTVLKFLLTGLYFGSVQCILKRSELQIYRGITVEESHNAHPVTYSLNELETTPICGVDIPPLANATWAYAAKDGSVILYTCNVGFSTKNGDNAFEFSCNAGANMTGTELPDSCSIIQCSRPEAIPYASLVWPGGPSVLKGYYDSIVSYNCDVGFSGDGEADGPRNVKMVCDDSGQYQFLLVTITGCLPIACGVPLHVRNGLLPNTTDTSLRVAYNQSITYTCASGYVSSVDSKSDNYTLTCDDSGEFVPNDPLPHCEEIQCSDPPLLEHASTVHVSGKVTVDSRVIYRCDTGYLVSEIPLSQTFSIRCELVNELGQYAIPSPEKRCNANACLQMPNLVNSVVDSTNSVWRYTDLVPFKCITGYTLGGVKGKDHFSGHCNSQGVWTINDTPRCDKVQCGTSTDIPSDLLEYTKYAPFEGNTAVYGMNSTVVCVDGAVVVGSGGTQTGFVMECGPDGEFISADGGLCAIPCPIIPKVSFSRSRDFGRILEWGEEPAVVTCKEGFQMSTGDADQEIFCNRDGTLSAISQCTPIPNYFYGRTDHGDGNIDVWPYQDGGSLSDQAYIRKSAHDRGVGVFVVVASLIILLH